MSAARPFRRAVVTGGAGFLGAHVCRRLLEAGTAVVIVRLFNTYGPGMRPDDGRMVPRFACQALRGHPLTVAGDGRQTRSLCHVDDTVRGMLLFAASDLRGPLNIGNPDEATVLEIARRIIGLARSRSTISYIPRPQDDPMVRRPDITLARCELRFEPRVRWQEGLRETLAWFAEQLDPESVPRLEPSLGEIRGAHATTSGHAVAEP